MRVAVAAVGVLVACNGSPNAESKPTAQAAPDLGVAAAAPGPSERSSGAGPRYVLVPPRTKLFTSDSDPNPIELGDGDVVAMRYVGDVGDRVALATVPKAEVCGRHLAGTESFRLRLFAERSALARAPGAGSEETRVVTLDDPCEGSKPAPKSILSEVVREVWVHGHRVAAGVAADWCAGGAAGVSVDEEIFRDPPTTIDGRRCFTRQASGLVTPMCLCFAPQRVEAWEGMAPAMGFPGTVNGVDMSRSVPAKSKIGRGTPDVKGPLPKEIVQRVVRSHVPQIRACYETALLAEPSLSGDVTIRFVISPAGKVSVASVQETTLGDRTAANCIAKAFRTWSFPAPRGGSNVVVSMPLQLSPRP